MELLHVRALVGSAYRGCQRGKLMAQLRDLFYFIFSSKARGPSVEICLFGFFQPPLSLLRIALKPAGVWKYDNPSFLLLSRSSYGFCFPPPEEWGWGQSQGLFPPPTFYFSTQNSLSSISPFFWVLILPFDTRCFTFIFRWGDSPFQLPIMRYTACESGPCWLSISNDKVLIIW